MSAVCPGKLLQAHKLTGASICQATQSKAMHPNRSPILQIKRRGERDFFGKVLTPIESQVVPLPQGRGLKFQDERASKTCRFLLGEWHQTRQTLVPY